MTSVITYRGRIYTLAFYRVLKNQADDAVAAFRNQGHCAFKRRVEDSKGVPVWGIFDGGKKKRLSSMGKKKQALYLIRVVRRNLKQAQNQINAANNRLLEIEKRLRKEGSE